MKKITEFRLPKLTRGQKVLRNLIVIAGMCFIMFSIFIGFDRPCTTTEEAMDKCLENAGMKPPYSIEYMYWCKKEDIGFNEFPDYTVVYVRTTQAGKAVDIVMYINGINPSPYKVFGPKKVTYSAYIDRVEPVEETDYDVIWFNIYGEKDLEDSSENFIYTTEAFPGKKIDGQWTNRADRWFLRIDFDDQKYFNAQTQIGGQLFANVYKDDLRVEWIKSSEYTEEQAALIGEELAAKMADDLAEDFEKHWTRCREYNAIMLGKTSILKEELIKE